MISAKLPPNVTFHYDNFMGHKEMCSSFTAPAAFIHRIESHAPKLYHDPQPGLCAPIAGAFHKCRTRMGMTSCFTDARILNGDDEETTELLEATDEMWGVHAFYKGYCINGLTDDKEWPKIEAYAKSKKTTFHDGWCNPHVWENDDRSLWTIGH